MIPIQITIKDELVSPAIETKIREKTEKLHRFYNRITSCRVVVESCQKHKHQGKLFTICIDVTVPGKEFIANKNQNEDVYIAMADAFNAITRQLEEHSRKRHGRVKSHNGIAHGHVVRIVKENGYGFIEDDAGTEYYFSMTNIGRADLSQFTIGDAVAFTPEIMNDGHHANHVIKERW